MQIHEKLVNGKYKKAKRKKIWCRCFYWLLPERKQFIHSADEPPSEAQRTVVGTFGFARNTMCVTSDWHGHTITVRVWNFWLQCPRDSLQKAWRMKMHIAIMWMNDERWIPRLLDFHACEFKCAESFLHLTYLFSKHDFKYFWTKNTMKC